MRLACEQAFARADREPVHRLRCVNLPCWEDGRQPLKFAFPRKCLDSKTLNKAVTLKRAETNCYWGQPKGAF